MRSKNTQSKHRHTAAPLSSCELAAVIGGTAAEDHVLLAQAIERASGNGRKTVRPVDL